MGGLGLDSEDKIAARLAGVLRQVESGGMPRGNKLPSSDERATFVTWLKCELDSATPADSGGQGGGIDVDEDLDGSQQASRGARLSTGTLHDEMCPAVTVGNVGKRSPRRHR